MAREGGHITDGEGGGGVGAELYYLMALKGRGGEGGLLVVV